MLDGVFHVLEAEKDVRHVLDVRRCTVRAAMYCTCGDVLYVR